MFSLQLNVIKILKKMVRYSLLVCIYGVPMFLD